jgi:hypothetical protein
MHHIEFWGMQEKMLEQEVNAISKSIKYFSNLPNYQRFIEKFNGYKTIFGKIKNFSGLFAALNESEEDIEELYCLLLGGHYKACILIMRTHFEFSNGIIRALKANQPIDAFNLQRATPQEHKFKARPLEISDEWRNEINSLYETLSRYAHPDGNKTGYKRLTPLP